MSIRTAASCAVSPRLKGSRFTRRAKSPPAPPTWRLSSPSWARRSAAYVKQVRGELLRRRRSMRELAASHGLKLMAAGAHPFSLWERVHEEESPRYRALIEDTQFGCPAAARLRHDRPRRLGDHNLTIDVMNAMRYLLPHVLCLANSSPFWQGRDTGLASHRSVLLDALPRTGIPNAFRSYNHYLSYVDTLLRTNSISDPEAIWWDIRPREHRRASVEEGDAASRPPNAARLPALEIRVCDALPEIDDVLAVAALIQSTVAWMVELRHRNMSFRPLRTHVDRRKQMAGRAVRFCRGSCSISASNRRSPSMICCTSCLSVSTRCWTGSTARR